MSAIRDVLKLSGYDVVRAIIEVANNHGGRVGFESVAAEIKNAGHCPEFDGDGPTVVKLLLDEYGGLMEGMIVYFDNDSQEFVLTEV